MSVRGDRVVYRTDREVEYDTRSSAGRSHRPEPRDAPTTTRKIYRVPREEEVEREERLTVIGGSDRHSERDRGYSENRIVIRREKDPEPEPVPERREIRVIERERERDPEIRRYERPVEREIRYERDYEKPVEREIRYERDLDRRDDLERYTRTVDYYPRPEPPPPIVIRQEPQQIIIQEAPRAPLVIPAPPKEEDFQLIQRSEIRQSERSEIGSRHDEERQIVRRPKPKEEEEEDYYYERRVREVSRDDRSHHEEDRHSRREREREVSPGDSISQYGRNRNRGYESDDSYEYIRKETREEYSDGESPHHRRHLAEGAIAGLGAAELLRHHRKKSEGGDSSRRSRVGKDLGAAALGVVGAQAVTRARSHYREKSKSRRGSRDRDRSRSRSRSREGRRKHRREKSRSRSRSKSRVKQLAGLGLGAAAVAAAVGYANRQNKKNQAEDRRSRSRVRKNSDGAPASDEADDARNPSHRNKKIAQAGLAGAAVAGLVERARSKSRSGRGKSRSKSRIRTGIPIAAAGLGSAAIAGLYERNQAGKKEKETRREERHARRERRSRSRSQSAPYTEGEREVPPAIEYGDAPVGYNNGGVPDYYNRPASQQGYYNNSQNAMVPAAAGGAAYSEQRERERHRSASASGSDEGRRRRRHRRHKSDSRSRSRSKGLATAAAAAGAAGLVASEHEKRKQRRKEEKRERRRQQEAEQASYGQDQYAQQQYSPHSPTPAGYVANGQQQPYFPPPPGAPFTPPGANYPPEYQNQHAIPANAQVHPDYGYPPQGGFQPPVPDAYSPPPGAAGYAPQQPREPRRADENVSAVASNVSNNDVPLYDSNGAPFYYEPNKLSGEGVKTPRAQSPSRPPLQRRATSQPPTKSVKFNLSPTSSGRDSPTQIRNRRERTGSSKQSHHDGGYDSEDSTRHDRTRQQDGPEAKRKRHHRRASVDNPRDHSPTSSDSTIELPERFDKQGRPIPQTSEDPLTEKIQELFSGNGSVGRFLQSLGGGSDDSEDRDGRRRRRRR